MRVRTLAVCFLFLLLCTGAALRPAPVAAQLTPADSASVLLETARAFEADGRWEVAEALYRLIVERYGSTATGAEARERLLSPPREVVYGSGNVELQIWGALYGSWLGIAVPGALGADSPGPYGTGLLLGGPSGFLAGRSLARALSLTEGQARAITLGGSWGTWQGYGWREVFDFGVEQICDPAPFGGGEFCFGTEDSSEEAFAAMIIGGLTGIAAGALLSDRDITPGTGTVVNFGSLWGSWFGVAGGIIFGLEDDDLLAATLLGGNAGLAATAVLAPGWNVSRSRARLVSIAGVLGGLSGAGIDLITQPDNEKVAIGIPLVASIVGLGIGIAATRDDDPSVLGLTGSASDGALLRLDDGRLSVATPVPVPTLVPWEGATGHGWRTALRVELFRASF